ncbi:MAG TPA: hypothetical protein PKJ33_02530 [Alphaproteobacteria bacterium]|nr:hypothetical protein [Alphaproteobacteria bacterium]
MPKAKNILLGTMLVGALVGGSSAAQAQSAKKINTSTEKQKKQVKEFHDEGISIIMTKSEDEEEISLKIDQSKLSDAVKERMLFLESLTSNQMASDNPVQKIDKKLFKKNALNPNSKTEKDFNDIQEKLREISKYAQITLLNLPANSEKYENIKGNLIWLISKSILVGTRLVEKTEYFNNNNEYKYSREKFLLTVNDVLLIESLTKEDVANLNFDKKTYIVTPAMFQKGR